MGSCTTKQVVEGIEITGEIIEQLIKTSKGLATLNMNYDLYTPEVRKKIDIANMVVAHS